MYIYIYLNWSFVTGMVIPPWPDDLKSTISTLARILIGGTQIVCTRAEFGLQVCVDRRGYWWLWVCGCVGEPVQIHTLTDRFVCIYSDRFVCIYSNVCRLQLADERLSMFTYINIRVCTYVRLYMYIYIYIHVYVHNT